MGLKQLLSRLTSLRRSRESGNPGALPLPGLGRRANRVGPALADGWELGPRPGHGRGVDAPVLRRVLREVGPCLLGHKAEAGRRRGRAPSGLRPGGPAGGAGATRPGGSSTAPTRSGRAATCGGPPRPTSASGAPPTGGWSATTGGSRSRCGRSGPTGYA